ncbi:MAG: excinuclease ABC subunit UvrB [Clostridiales bacterium]|nr:excinuclease ABC subunit UvrB [Clostridiales bacterium]
MGVFKLRSDYKPSGDQPQAIEKLVAGVNAGMKGQTLLGVTGSGKTFTMANVIQQCDRPALIIAHNKTLAGQLYAEFKELFPDNAVGYFVSYYDYYQPEAYISATDTYIEKDSSTNREIDRMRHEATRNLLTRRDVIIVASVSCIYGIGEKSDYESLVISLEKGQEISRDEVLSSLIEMQYQRNDFAPDRGEVRCRGDNIDIYTPDNDNYFTRISFFGDEIDQISYVDILDMKTVAKVDYVDIFPASHYAAGRAKLERAEETIAQELEGRLKELQEEGKAVAAYRLEQRTLYDLDMLKETGFCKGIENYSRHIAGRAPGSPPCTLMDFFPEDYLVFIDESHQTIPQIGAMQRGDHARKESLVEHGFRLPSAFDNRPLIFSEFESKLNSVIFVSATPADYEKEHSEQTVEQVIRPTGLTEPEIYVRPVEGQIEDILSELKANIARGEKSLILTLTKKMAEDLTDFLKLENIRVDYLHSDIKTVERMKILNKLREDKTDVIVGINLLREGIDLPEVSLLMILDADKEGFLRSERSLIQIIGRCARNVNGRVILYADEVTDSMMGAVAETNRRRKIQQDYNREHNIIPVTVRKTSKFETDSEAEDKTRKKKDKAGHVIDIGAILAGEEDPARYRGDKDLIDKLEKEMKKAASSLDFEHAAELRDALILIKG